MDMGLWISTTATIEGLRYIPVDNEISIKAVSLPGEFHADPADQMIVALARRVNAPLVSADKKILAYAHVNAIW
jgi:PIN domain nuclease of toxin-antitoxin system